MNAQRQLALLLGLTLCVARIDGARADDLGRLFTSAAERARIDALRSGQQPDSTDDAPGTDRAVINGTLRGSDGKRLVWLNGTPVKPGGASHLSLLRDGRVQLTWRDGARILKPGQGVDQATGNIFENHTPVPAPVVKETVAATKPEVAPASTPDTAATTTAAAKPAVESKAK